MSRYVEDDRYIYYNDGKIFSKFKRGFMKLQMMPNGYLAYIDSSYKPFKRFLVHRTIYTKFNGEIPGGKCIDHINDIRDDNRLENLQLLTQQQNTQKQGVSRANKSGYKGISFHKLSKKWRARINYNTKEIHLGLFENIEDAVIAYNNYATYLNETENCHYTLN